MTHLLAHADAQGVPRTVLQLVSVACVLIACKHEEVSCTAAAIISPSSPCADLVSVSRTALRCPREARLCSDTAAITSRQETHPSVERLTELAGFAFQVRKPCDEAPVRGRAKVPRSHVGT